MQTQFIYKVTTEGDVEGKSTRILGYAAGTETDIRNFYEDKKAYTLIIESITILNITSESVNEKKELIAEKKKLEARLQTIKNILG